MIVSDFNCSNLAKNRNKKGGGVMNYNEQHGFSQRKKCSSFLCKFDLTCVFVVSCLHLTTTLSQTYDNLYMTCFVVFSLQKHCDLNLSVLFPIA